MNEQTKKEKAAWWVNMLFSTQELQCVIIGDENKAEELRAVKKFILEKLEEKDE